MTRKMNPDQFKLFMSANEWKDSIEGSTDLYQDQTLDELWDDKLRESKATGGGVHGAGSYASLEKEGFREGINPNRGELYNQDGYVYHGADGKTVNAPFWGYSGPSILVDKKGRNIQAEGHHRIAAAADIEKKTGKTMWIPANYNSWESETTVPYSDMEEYRVRKSEDW